MAHGQIQPFTLTDGIMGNPFMRPENLSVFIDKMTLWQFLPCIIIKKFLIIAVRDKANVLAVRFRSDQKSHFFRHLTDFILCIIAHRHQSF